MRDMNSDIRRFSVVTRGRRGAVALVLSLGALMATLAAVSVSASTPVAESRIVAADQLAAHGIELKPIPATALSAVVSAESARETARQLVGAPSDPEETYRILASKSYFSPKQTAWLFLFTGGRGPGSVGPPEGADSRTFTTEYTGVLVDDQTGEVLRWFQGGSFEP